MTLSAPDRAYLRDLATRVAEIAADPYNEERRNWWYSHNDLKPVRPLALAFPEGSWRELMSADTLKLNDPVWRGREAYLRQKIYRWENIRDDNVIEPTIEAWAPRREVGWNAETRLKRLEGVGSEAAGTYDPILKEPEDFAILGKPHLEIDHEEKARIAETMNDVFGDILTFRWNRNTGVNTNPVRFICFIRGLEQVMLDMIDRPEWLHEVFSFVMENSARLLDEVEASGELELTDGETYVGSGGTAYTRQLPADDFGGTVRLNDLWGFAQSQEYTLVSPEMYDEFGLQYQAPLLERFGLNCYGCCEDMTDKLDIIIRRIPNLRRISITPWTDVQVAADKLQDRYIYSWKPNPACICDPYDPDSIRAEIRRTLEITRGCVVEMILKDTHTCNHQPERFATWVRIAQEEAERVAS